MHIALPEVQLIWPHDRPVTWTPSPCCDTEQLLAFGKGFADSIEQLGSTFLTLAACRRRPEAQATLGLTTVRFDRQGALWIRRMPAEGSRSMSACHFRRSAL